MGRPRKTDRYDEDIEDVRADTDRDDREPQRADFDNEMFADKVESPLNIPESLWPDGMALRWIAITVDAAPHNVNWSAKTAAGWTPVERGKYPKIDARFPTVPMPGQTATVGGAIVFGGLCLCMRDIRYNIRDRKKQQRDTIEAGKTIESYVEGGNSSVPRFNQSGPVQFERGRAQFKE